MPACGQLAAVRSACPDGRIASPESTGSAVPLQVTGRPGVAGLRPGSSARLTCAARRPRRDTSSRSRTPLADSRAATAGCRCSRGEIGGHLRHEGAADLVHRPRRGELFRLVWRAQEALSCPVVFLAAEPRDVDALRLDPAAGPRCCSRSARRRTRPGTSGTSRSRGP